MRRWIWRIVGLVLLAAVGYGAWVILNPNQDPGGREMGAVATDFKTLKLTARSNKYLVLPPGFSGGDRPDGTSPVFRLPPADLARQAKALLLKQPRTELVRDIDAAHQFELVQRSALFRFPDYVVIQAFPAGDGQAALAIYSRSKYGRKDFGVNRKRVTAWLDALKTALPAN